MPGHTDAHGGPNRPGPSGFDRDPTKGGGGSDRPPGLFGSPGAAGSVGFTGTTVGAGPQFGGGGGQDPIPTVSEALVSAAPEVVEETPTQDTNSFLDFFNNRILNPIVDSYYNLTPLTFGGLTPSEFGIMSLYGNIFNFNPSVDEETGEISTSLLGPVGTATFGKLNIDNYKDYQGLMNPQDFYSAAFVDPATGELYDNTNFEALKTYTDNMGAVLKPGKDLEQNLRDNMDTNKDGKIDGFDFAGDGGPADVYIPPSSQTQSGAFAGQSQSQSQSPQPTGQDLQAIYNGLSSAEQDTVDTMMGFDEGYDLAYALRYVLGGNPLF